MDRAVSISLSRVSLTVSVSNGLTECINRHSGCPRCLSWVPTQVAPILGHTRAMSEFRPESALASLPWLLSAAGIFATVEFCGGRSQLELMAKLVELFSDTESRANELERYSDGSRGTWQL